DVATSYHFDYAWHKKFHACFSASADYLCRHGIADRRWVLFSGDWQNGVEPGGTAHLNPMVSACALIELRAKLARY
ncbi:MAG: hypothetical protein K2L78_02335, partial [Muribaculaceae bacterium]|nr:hypothetical protein [Muribaculaceae bacterium]